MDIHPILWVPLLDLGFSSIQDMRHGAQILDVVSTTWSKGIGNNGSITNYTKIKIKSCNMISSQGMDELF